MNKTLELLAEEIGTKYLPQDAREINPKNSQCWIAPIIDGDLKENQIYAHGDIYEMLTDEKAVDIARKAQSSGAIAIFTCGWAAPHNPLDNDENEIAPSKHPARRRVAIMLVASPNGDIVTSMRMDSDDLIVNSEGKGSIAEAIDELWQSADI